MARSKKEFGKQARAFVGLKDRVEEVPTFGADPRDVAREEQRLAAAHDPNRPSACRCCGVSTAPGADERSGWKICRRCVGLLPGGLAVVLSDALGVEVAESEAFGLADQLPAVGNPCVFLRGWPTDDGASTRWAHIAAGDRAQAPVLLAAMRDRRPKVNSDGSGCAMCGQSRSTSWTRTGWRKGRNGPRVNACAECQATIVGPSGGSEESWRPRVLAAATGMSRPQLLVTFGVKAFFESDAPDAGSAEAWQYLGDTRAKLRAKVIRSYGRWVVLDAREERVLALERTVAAAERPLVTPLADV